MMLARLAPMTRANQARVGPRDTRSITPIRSFLMFAGVILRPPAHVCNHAAGRCRRRAGVEFRERVGRTPTLGLREDPSRPGAAPAGLPPRRPARVGRPPGSKARR